GAGKGIRWGRNGALAVDVDDRAADLLGGFHRGGDAWVVTAECWRAREELRERSQANDEGGGGAAKGDEAVRAHGGPQIPGRAGAGTGRGEGRPGRRERCAVASRGDFRPISQPRWTPLTARLADSASARAGHADSRTLADR